MFTMRDIERMCRETGVSREEAVRLLRRACGDYKQAMRNYIGDRNVYVEAEKVEENERSPRAFLQRLLSALRLSSEERRAAACAAALIVIMLALVMAPQATACTLLVLLFLRWGAGMFAKRQIV